MRDPNAKEKYLVGLLSRGFMDKYSAFCYKS